MPTFRARIGGCADSSFTKPTLGAQLRRSYRTGGGDPVPESKPIETKDGGTGTDPKQPTTTAKTAGDTAAEVESGRASTCPCATDCNPRSDGQSYCYVKDECKNQPGTQEGYRGIWRYCDPNRIASTKKVTNAAILAGYQQLAAAADRLLAIQTLSPLLRESLNNVRRGLASKITEFNNYFGPLPPNSGAVATQLRQSAAAAEANIQTVRDIDAWQRELTNLQQYVPKVTAAFGVFGNNPTTTTATTTGTGLTAVQIAVAYRDLLVRTDRLLSSPRLQSADDRRNLQNLRNWLADKHAEVSRFLSGPNGLANQRVVPPPDAWTTVDNAFKTIVDVESRMRSVVNEPAIDWSYPRPSSSLPSNRPITSFAPLPYTEPAGLDATLDAIASSSSSATEDLGLLNAEQVANVWPEDAPPALSLGMMF